MSNTVEPAKKDSRNGGGKGVLIFAGEKKIKCPNGYLMHTGQRTSESNVHLSWVNGP